MNHLDRPTDENAVTLAEQHANRAERARISEILPGDFRTNVQTIADDCRLSVGGRRGELAVQRCEQIGTGFGWSQIDEYRSRGAIECLQCRATAVGISRCEGLPTAVRRALGDVYRGGIHAGHRGFRFYSSVPVPRYEQKYDDEHQAAEPTEKAFHFRVA